MQIDNEDRKKRILVVDDFTNMRRTIKNMLRQIGFDHIEEADDGDTALEKIKNHNIKFVVCDWNMPRMPGIHLLKAVRTSDKHKDTPFLMITAENWEEEITEAAEENVDGYIIKPFVTKTLEEKISDILAKKRNPSEGEQLFKKGKDFIDKQMYTEAIETLGKVLEIKPDSAKAQHMLGTVYFAQGNLNEAEERFKQALNFNKRYVKTYHSMAELMIKNERFEEAIKNLQLALAISPRISERQLLLGYLLLKIKKHKEAIAPFKKGLEYAYKTEEEKEKITTWLSSIPPAEKEHIMKALEF